MIYCFDLDNTLCSNTNGDYDNSNPILSRIEVVNDLYDKGHTIIIDTARGSVTGIDWFETTKNQLDLWGVKYHKLYVGRKLHYDIIVDDKAINDLVFFNNII